MRARACFHHCASKAFFYQRAERLSPLLLLHLSDRAQVAVGGSGDCALRVRQDVRLPPTPEDLLERVWLDRFENAMDGGGVERNKIRIAAHEADVTAILHDCKDIAGQQRALTVRATGPVQHGAAFEMSAAINQRDSVPEWQRCSFPKSNARTFA